MIPVKMVMRREVLSTNVNTPVRKVAERLQDRRIGSLLVMDGQQIVGILTEADIVQKVVAAGRDLAHTMAGDIMSSPLITIESEASVVTADELMDREHIRHLAVKEKGKIVGVVSVRDLLFPLQYTSLFPNADLPDFDAWARVKPADRKGAPAAADTERRQAERVQLKKSGNKMGPRHPFGRVRAENLMERDIPYYPQDALGLTLATAMINRHCGAIPIVDEHRELVGIVTEFDLLNAMIQGMDLEKVKAGEMMAREPKFVRKETVAEEIIRIMDSLHLIHIPVVDQNEKLVGLIERSDVLLGYLESRQGTLQV